MPRKIEQFVGQWESLRQQRQLRRDLAAASPRLREDYASALRLPIA